MSGFYIDVYNSAGTKINANSYQIRDVQIVDRVNRIGEITFTLPAVVARDNALEKRYSYKVYHEVQGYIGQYYHDDLTVDADNMTATIHALDELVLLANRITLFNRSHVDEMLTAVLSDLVDIVGWGKSLEAGIGSLPLTIEFQGESILTALDTIRSYMRGYFRRDPDNITQPAIYFGMYGTLGSTWSTYGGFTYGSGTYKGELGAVPAGTKAWLLNPAVLSSLTDAPTEYAIITRLQRQSKGGNVITRVYPIGAGLGQTQLDLRYSDRTSSYSIQSQANPDGSLCYYLDDAYWRSQYGLIERTLPFRDIRPITNSAADLTNAANALYDIASNYLGRFNQPQEIYSVSCVNLPAGVYVGDIIVINFYGVAELEDGAHAFLSLENAPFFITEMRRTYGETGNPTYDLTISTTGEAQADTVDIFTNVLTDLDKFKVRPQPSQTYYNKASPTLPIDSTRYIDFKFRMGAEVLLLNEMRVEFMVMPLRSSTSNIASGGGDLVTSEPNGGGTLTADAGGGSTPTSNDGGGLTASSANASASHEHIAFIMYSGSSGSSVYFDGGTIQSPALGSPTNIVTSSVGSTSHSHTVPIPAHTHVVPIPSHQHTVPIANHTHGVDVADHTHNLSFGVIDDTVVPSTLTVWVNSVQATNIRNAETGTFVGNSVSAAGLYDVDILALLTSSDFRNRSHTIRFQCTSGQGQVFAQVLGRVTIQPIAV